MDLISEIVERAKANKQRIVLPEGTEERTLKAANQILTDGVADLILLGTGVRHVWKSFIHGSLRENPITKAPL